MLFVILILIAAGVYACVKREIKANANFVIREKAAIHIGVALILGGIGAIAVPLFLNITGLSTGFVSDLVSSISSAFLSLAYVASIMVIEKRKNRGITFPPP